MFGHNDQQAQDDNQPASNGALDDQSAGTAQSVNDTAGDYIDDGPIGGPTITQPDNTAAADSTDDSTAISNNAPTLPTPQPPVPPAPADDTDDSYDDDTGVSGAEPVASPTPAGTTSPDSDQLLGIKQQALQQLTPLVGHLEQTPEEKFRTTMMMIQASDNHELIQVAYEAAQQIQDEKVRAQALLDIVNEINYFTQSHAETS